MAKGDEMPSEGLPGQAQVEAALLRFMTVKSRPITPSEAYRGLADVFSLTREQRERQLLTEPRSEWENLVRFAKRRLVDRGLVTTPKRSIWELTPLGKMELTI